MFTGEHVPYTNFHDLNLDEIIKLVLEGKNKIEEFETTLTQYGIRLDEFQEYIDSLDEIIDQKVSEELPIAIQQEIETGGFNDLLSNAIKRRIVFIGDSYATGYTPDGSVQGWPERVATIMNIDSTDYVKAGAGGAGFWVTSVNDERYIPNLITTAHNNITNPETVTDIVLGFGYNDINAYTNESTLKQTATAVLTKINELFPQNPKIWLFGIGYSTNHEIQRKLMSVYRIYGNFNTFGFQKLTQRLCYKSYFSSDGIHPNNDGQDKIAQLISQMLNNGNCNEGSMELLAYGTEILLKNINDQSNFNGSLYAFKQNDQFILSCPTSLSIRTGFQSNKPTLGQQPIKIGTYENTRFTGFHNWSYNAQMVPCTIVYTADNLTGYHSVNGYINIAPENTESNTLYIWLYAFGTNDQHTGFFTQANINSLQISGFTMTFNLIG